MNDDLTFGTPDGIDEDEIQQMQQDQEVLNNAVPAETCLLYTSPSPRDRTRSRMPSSA